MSILVDSSTKVICQGMTGKQATFYVDRAIATGTRMVAGVTPGKGGTRHLGLPVFNTVAEARQETQASATVIFVPRENAKQAILEAVAAEMELVVCITEHIPVKDMLEVSAAVADSGTRLIGPNSPGIITPGQCRIGIMPAEIFKPGKVGIVSRSSTLTYEAVGQTTISGLGQSTCIGIGGDPVHGMRFADCLELFRQDDETEVVVIIGEIGGSEEEHAAEYLYESSFEKPVVAYIAGQHAPVEKRMGHASAIIANGSGSARGKMLALDESGATVVDSPVDIGETVRKTISK